MSLTGIKQFLLKAPDARKIPPDLIARLFPAVGFQPHQRKSMRKGRAGFPGFFFAMLGGMTA
jgi:hypothetical protein